ncbi:MAG: hypothetical protein ABIQ95_00945 [Bdellovibrionia bacterium]
MENAITIDMIDDWAGAAMQGLIMSRGRDKDFDISEIAEVAYDIAREMARARGLFIDSDGDRLVEPEEEDGEI